MNGSDEIKMICDVDQVTKNLRYKVLTINGDFYILDMNQFFWMFLFPFFFWFTPHKIYKVDKVIADEIKKEEINKEGSLSTFGQLGVVMILGTFIKPIINFLEIQSSLKINLFILLIFIGLIIGIRLRVSKMSERQLFQFTHLKELKTDKIHIKPQPFKYIIKYLYLYLFSWAISIASGLFFLIYGNIFALIGSLMMLFMGLMANNQAIRAGKAKIKFVQ